MIFMTDQSRMETYELARSQYYGATPYGMVNEDVWHSMLLRN